MSQNLVVPASDAEVAGFAATLREHTKTIHRAAERAGFIADLLHGRATLAGYALFLRNLHPVYAALELALIAHTRDPLAGAFADPRLHRLAAFTSDLHVIVGADWSALPLLPAAEAYVETINAAARDPARLAAHAYARYLGDLSGGQILKPLLARTLGIGTDGLAFYDFPAFADLAAPKAAMRNALDTVPTFGPRATAICAEAVTAFAHNIALSEAVQAALATT